MQFETIGKNSVGTCGGVFLLVVLSMQFDKSITDTRVYFAVCDKTKRSKLCNKYYFMNQLEKNITGCTKSPVKSNVKFCNSVGLNFSKT